MKRQILLILLLAVGHCRAMETEEESNEQLVDQIITDLNWNESSESEQEEETKKYKSELSKFGQQLYDHQRLLVDREGSYPVAQELLPLAGEFVSPTSTSFYILYPLHLAIRNNKILCAKSLLLEGANPNGQDHVGKRPLHLAVSVDDDVSAKLINRLWLSGAFVDGADKLGNTPLTLAVQQNKLETVKLLLAKSAKPNINVDAEQKWNKEGISDIYAVGTSPLYAAACCSNHAMVTLLIEEGAQIKQTEHVAAQICYNGLSDGTKKALFARILGILS